MADLVLAVDIGGTKMAAGLVALDGSLVERELLPTRAGLGAGEGDPVAAEALWEDLAGLVGRVGGAAGPDDRLVVCGVGCGGPMAPGGERGVAAEHLGLALLSPAPAPRRADRAADLRRQRRQGARTRRGVARRRGRRRRLHRHGRVHRGGWRHRPQRPAARRPAGQRGAHRPRHRGAGRSLPAAAAGAAAWRRRLRGPRSPPSQASRRGWRPRWSSSAPGRSWVVPLRRS